MNCAEPPNWVGRLNSGVSCVLALSFHRAMSGLLRALVRRGLLPIINQMPAAGARNHEIDCVLIWKFDCFARSTRHLLAALEEFDHLGVRFISVQDQVDTESPMGRAMFTIIGAMAELESSLISERVTAGMQAAEARGKHIGRPQTPQHVVSEIVALATSTDLSIGQIQGENCRARKSQYGR